jgi:4-aminobutyrate aminotransferase-like enzyme
MKVEVTRKEIAAASEGDGDDIIMLAKKKANEFAFAGALESESRNDLVDFATFSTVFGGDLVAQCAFSAFMSMYRVGEITLEEARERMHKVLKSTYDAMVAAVDERVEDMAGMSDEEFKPFRNKAKEMLRNRGNIDPQPEKKSWS